MPPQIELVVITPMEVSAFVDGELGAEERSDVEACMRDDDRASCLVSAWCWQLGLLHAAFAPAVDEPPPARLRLNGRGDKPRNGRRRRALSA